MNKTHITPHRRYNPLIEEWIIVSPQRDLRPWQGQIDNPEQTDRVSYEPSCYLCPTNERNSGVINPNYQGTHVFDNDSPALLSNTDTPIATPTAHPLVKRSAINGRCRVICYSPDHSLSMASLCETEIQTIINTCVNELSELGQKYTSVQIFENKGPMMGCSSPHPHGQIWATSEIPTEVLKEHRTQTDYFNEHGRALLLDYAQHELEAQERLVFANEHWLVLVPYWAAWPFETLVLPRNRVIEHLDRTTEPERSALASALKRLTTRYDNLFQVSFPYSMGWHGSPGGIVSRGWQCHAHFYPPLLRSASIRKFMVGFELLAEAQRDITPEAAAARLRAASEVHYLDRDRS